MLVAIILLPALAGIASFALPWHGVRRLLWVVTAGGHGFLTVALWLEPPPPAHADDVLFLDAAGQIFLGITSLLFLVAAVYGVGYLAKEKVGPRPDFFATLLFRNEPEAVFTGCLLLFLSSMTLVIVSQHFGLMWVAIEATTLASAPLIYFHRHPRSLEAAWKYLLICSVGIALALLGNYLLAAWARPLAGEHFSLTLGHLRGTSAAKLSEPALMAAFLFFLVGYGTKMGLAPLHTWLPDAHSEAPSLVSALLSGALLNCSLLALLRAFQVCLSAGLGDFARELLILFGLISMGVAAVFILGQTDFKRMLAYSSVEHMGILALGIGLGGQAGPYGAMLHAINHSLTKATLFLAAGNILAAFHTKNVHDVRGLARVLPVTGLLWLGGFLALTGSPPFGPFLSEFTILKAALEADRPLVAVLYLVFLALIFVGMATIVLRMVQGPAGFLPGEAKRERWWAILPPALLGLGVLVLGLYVPPVLQQVLENAGHTLGGR